MIKYKSFAEKGNCKALFSVLHNIVSKLPKICAKLQKVNFQIYKINGTIMLKEVRKMSIRWIVTDMDGTLLNSHDRISKETEHCLLACQEKGIRLILASGRSYVRLMPYAQQLHMEKYGGRLIEVNGLAVNYLDSKERQVFSQLYKKDIEELFYFLREQKIEIQAYKDDAFYYWIPEWQMPYKIAEREEKGYLKNHPLAGSSWSWIISDDFSHNYPHIIEASSIEQLPESINKLNCLDYPEKIDKVCQMLKERFPDLCEVVRTSPRLIEIAPKGITKGKTLCRLMEKEGIGPEEVMVFGDGENDVDMFRQVTYSIAMGNAASYVKKYAFDITGTNDEDGIAASLKRYRVL